MRLFKAGLLLAIAVLFVATTNASSLKSLLRQTQQDKPQTEPFAAWPIQAGAIPLPNTPRVTEGEPVPVWTPRKAEVTSYAPKVKQPRLRKVTDADIERTGISVDPYKNDYNLGNYKDFANSYDPMPNYNKKKFPDGPHDFTYDSVKSDLPLSSQGRWLHTSVILEGNQMWVYGGISTYTDKLYNDMWVYDYLSMEWNQIQKSFVPPFPPADGRPSDVPPPEDYKDAPVGLRPPPRPVPVYHLPDARIVGGVGFVDDVENATVAAQAKIKFPDLVEPSNEVDLNLAKFVELESTITAQDQQLPYARNGEFGIDYHKLQISNNPSAGHTVGSKSIPFPMGPNGKYDYSQVTGDSKNGVENWPSMPTDLWLYNLDTKVWQCILPKSGGLDTAPAFAPVSRWLHTAVALAGRMVIFGGVTEDHRVMGDIWMWDPKAHTWTQAAPLGPAPLPREGHVATGAGVKMWVFGGVSYGYLPFNDVWEYNLELNKWTVLSDGMESTAPVARWLTAMDYILHGNDNAQATLFLFGGVTRDYIPINDLFAFNTGKKQWTRISSSEGFAPFPRMMHQIGILGRRIYVVGGVANNIVFEDLNYFDLDAPAETGEAATSGSWVEQYQTETWPFARAGMSLARMEPKFEPQMNRPLYKPQHDPPNAVPNPRYRKSWVYDHYLIMFGGAGTVQS